MTENASKFRLLTGPARAIELALLTTLTLVGALWATQLHHRLPWAFFNEQFLGLFLALSLASVFVVVKARRRDDGARVPWYDWILAVAGLVVGGYVTAMYPTIAYRLGVLSLDRSLLAGAAVLLVLEATRRIAGGTLAWVALALVLYTRFASFFPGLLYAKGASWKRLATYLYLDTSGLFGVPLNVAASVLVPGDEEGQQKRRQRQQESHDLSRDSRVTKQGQVLPDGAANAPADQHQQELAGRQAKRP